MFLLFKMLLSPLVSCGLVRANPSAVVFESTGSDISRHSDIVFGGRFMRPFIIQFSQLSWYHSNKATVSAATKSPHGVYKNVRLLFFFLLQNGYFQFLQWSYSNIGLFCFCGLNTSHIVHSLAEEEELKETYLLLKSLLVTYTISTLLLELWPIITLSFKGVWEM